MGNGWANVDRNFLRDKIEGRLTRAGYKLAETRTSFNNESGSNDIMRRYTHPQYGDAYVQAVHGWENDRGRFAYGNVDVYRGGYGERYWSRFKK